jgi:hypothetical protein
VTRQLILALLLLPLALLGGCRGQLRDYVGPRSNIVRPQLIRYGFSLPEIACVGERLGETVRTRELRLLVRATSNIAQPYYDPARFSPRDFAWAAGGLRDAAVDSAVREAFASCHVDTNPRVTATTPPPEGGPATPPLSRASVWLNLGAAASGQSIAVDGATLVQAENTRTAWFRMIDPPPGRSSLHAYLLRIDCGTRMIRPLAHRLYDAGGAIVEEREYAEAEQLLSAVEGGTVTEIAYLSLCT